MTRHSTRRTRLTPSLGDTSLQPIHPPVPDANPGFDDGGAIAYGEIFDDFNGSAGSAPNTANWLVDTVNQGGIQTYTTGSANVRLDGASNLVLEAVQSGSPGSYTYTSGRVTTRYKWNFGYGKLSARIKFPKGPGFNPGFWLLQQGTYGSPAAEIDMMEMFGPYGASGGGLYHMTLHDHASPTETMVTSVGSVAGVSDLTAAFHEYWIIRSSNRIQIGIDDMCYADWNHTAQAANWAQFQRPMYLIMNLSVGGVSEFWGPPDGTTPWPAQILVDWVRWTPSIVSVPSRAITDSTSTGRAVLTAIDAPAARTAIGAASVRGATWYTGTGAPGTITGQLPNDFYLDTNTGQVYLLS